MLHGRATFLTLPGIISKKKVIKGFKMQHELTTQDKKKQEIIINH